jgi:hypothetical protein
VYAADRLLALDVATLYRLWRAHRAYFALTSYQAARAVLWGWGARPLLRATALRLMSSGLRTTLVGNLGRRRLLERLPPWLCPDRELRLQVIDRAVDVGPPSRLRQLVSSERERFVERADQFFPMEESFAVGVRPGAPRFFHPLLDVDVVEFLYNAPARLVTRAGEEKWLERAFLRRKLPPSASSRPASVFFDDFWALTFKRELPGVLDMTDNLPSLSGAGVVDGKRLSHAGRQLLTHEGLAYAEPLWKALSAEVWLQARS